MDSLIDKNQYLETFTLENEKLRMIFAVDYIL